MPLHFAYGSNMDRAAMRARCPGATLLGPARLPRHRPVILPEGYASVARDPRGTVWGLVWSLALADVPALDRYEEVGRGLYRKAVLPVLTASGPRRALVYLGRGEGGTPLPGTLEAVISAAREAGLPEGYLPVLAALRPRSVPGRRGLTSERHP